MLRVRMRRPLPNYRMQKLLRPTLATPNPRSNILAHLPVRRLRLRLRQPHNRVRHMRQPTCQAPAQKAGRLMPWGKLDDRFHSHPKVEAAGNAAVGAYCRCLAFCAAYYTDGFISDAQARKFGTQKELQKLTQTGLWITVSEGDEMVVSGRRDTGRRPLPDRTVRMPENGYFIGDFLHYHPTKEEDTTRKEARANAAQMRNQTRANAAQVSAHLLRSTRPDPNLTSESVEVSKPSFLPRPATDGTEGRNFNFQDILGDVA